MTSKIIQLRANREIHDLIERFLVGQSEEDRSSFIRRVVESEATLWLNSPYVSQRTLHFMFISKTGTFFYRRQENLRMNFDIEILPVNLEMKWEQVNRFLNKFRETPDEIRKLWLLNNFSVWHSIEDKKPFVEKEDKYGLVSKHVALSVNLLAGQEIIRESCAVVSDYAQYKEKDKESSQRWEPYDRADFSVDIPTRNVEIIVVIDADLWAHSAINLDTLSAPLNFVYRNRDEVAFQGEGRQGYDPSLQRVTSFSSKKDGDELYEESLKSARTNFKGMVSRFTELGLRKDQITNGGKGPGQPPKKFFFYRIVAPWVATGLLLSVRWVKPILPPARSSG